MGCTISEQRGPYFERASGSATKQSPINFLRTKRPTSTSLQSSSKNKVWLRERRQHKRRRFRDIGRNAKLGSQNPDKPKKKKNPSMKW